ncbi:3-deoxy-7-phosphoheptulonate synthase [Lichenihabitans sp. PAMC28606]|uniref:3-deoxy-7-phosphoheptulonate synthase n=1 Tax=Lichenihabitans sp. PAMC28606 TaxID=2880932 RepID=UPI001D0A1BC4|nr:3-deoxy-7-phosphoheptulonate synthase [Lichenihabitans sp. PAMC28606]UDL94244.1 3-deoxy-7-phosphoheptulonate synthase [Lichenihabitans sp. PAMC28606]
MLPSPDDTRIRSIQALSTPAEVMREFPRTPAATATVLRTRDALHDILHGRDDRLAVIVGPCSIHDPHAALDYAARLNDEQQRFDDRLVLVMRVYFEKPRTTVGWKGLINDPDLDGSFNVEKGLRLARSLLVDINSMGLAAGCEFLDMTTPQYLADLVGWGAIGARTTESQVHRELSSGLSCPVGFKNGTDGNVRIALDAMRAAADPHHFLAVTKDGRAAVAATTGNPDCHIILRGGRGPNFDAASVAAAAQVAAQCGLPVRIMIDASHANSAKKPENQPLVIADVAAQIASGDRRIMGAMVESHLVAGRQELVPGQPLVYGQSITDGCIDWTTTVRVLDDLADGVTRRRQNARPQSVMTSAQNVL